MPHTIHVTIHTFGTEACTVTSTKQKELMTNSMALAAVVDHLRVEQEQDDCLEDGDVHEHIMHKHSCTHTDERNHKLNAEYVR